MPRDKELHNYSKSTLNNDDIFVALNKITSGKKAYVTTFGCQANMRDGEIIEGLIIASGYQLTTNMEEADFILFNTCAIRQMAENRVKGELGRAKHLKKSKELIIAIAGCMGQEETNIAFFKEQNLVDIIIGPNTISSLPALLLEHLEQHTRLISIKDSSDIDLTGDYRQSGYKAFVHVMKGCDRFCSYCIVPYVRGREMSRTKEQILSELNELANKGFVHVCLVGQNVNAYGKNLNPPISFAALLKEVCKLPFARISFITSNVYDFTDELIDVIKDEPKILHHIHLPLQSGDDVILSKMNRRYNVAEYKSLYYKLREAIPDISITTDIIVGFPNEDLPAFENTYNLCKELKFDGAYTFIYSPRPHTPAAKMKDDVDAITKKQRLHRLNELITEDARARNEALLNTDQVVLIEEVVEKNNIFYYSGYDGHNKLVHFNAPYQLTIGQLVVVTITSVRAWSITGVINMQKTIKSISKQINEKLKIDDVVKVLKESLHQLETNAEVTKLQEELLNIKASIVKATVENDKLKEQLVARKEELERLYNSHPLVVNYRQAFEQFSDLVKQLEKEIKIS